MTEPVPPLTAESAGRRVRGCLLLVLAVLAGAGAVAGGGWWWWQRREAELLAAHEAQAREEFAPAQRKLDEALAEAGPVDLDKTIRVIHELDLAMKDTASLEDYLAYMARQDYRGVAPEVLRSRKKMLELLFRLHARQVEEKDQEEAWKISSETLLQLASLVSVGVNVDSTAAVPTGGSSHLAFDKAQAQKLLHDLEERRDARLKLRKDITGIETELLQTMEEYSAAWYGYVDQWDQLCLVRDRAYLAAASQDWPGTYAAATEAMRLAPQEKEAHLLAALARIEGGEAIDPEGPSAETILADYLAAHPGESAPALLLSGVAHQKAGRLEEARRDFQEAAAWYPKQSEQLTDLLNPYKSRAWLRKTREGGYIVQLYRSTMDGAGYFSPDLQLARLYFQGGDREAGRQKVLDHFHRRRTQAEWSYILDDVKFCEAWLGQDFAAMLPQASFLDLEVAPALLGEKVSLAVVNHSDRTLHNATLLLALHLTDQFQGDYEVMKAGDTQAAVKARETTDFGEVEIQVDVFGQTKGVKDVVEHRAILISDEAVSWVDTEVFKIAEADGFRKAREETGARSDPVAQTVAAAIERDAKMSWSSALGKDSVEITLPKELSLLSPTFRLKVGDSVLTPETRDLGEDGIKLRFDKVFNFDDDGTPRPDISLLVGGPGSMLELRWTPSGGFDYALKGKAEIR